IDENIIVGEKEYKGTPGLWELIVMKAPKDGDYTQDDYNNYAEILINTNALRKGKSSSPNGVTSSPNPTAVVIPSDPNALLERLDLLMASKAAGNTGVRNELVSICDELKRQKVL
ncbi:hypothetical protein CAPTEDRAFT_66123, partial [Capitella teleta]